MGSLVLPGCKKEAVPQPVARPSVTVESQAAKESRIKAEIQALLQEVGEGASYDPQLNFTGPIAHMLVEEAEAIRLEKLAGEGRLRFVKVAEKDMPRFYKLAQELNAVIKGRSYVNTFTFTSEDENGLPVYTIIINEKEFQKPAVELWITQIHEVLGRVSETEMSGKLASIEAEEARAYRKEVKVLNRVILRNEMFIQSLQGPKPSEEHSKLVHQVFDRETLMEKRDKAQQQAEYYQRKADAEPVIPKFIPPNARTSYMFLC